MHSVITSAYELMKQLWVVYVIYISSKTSRSYQRLFTARAFAEPHYCLIIRNTVIGLYDYGLLTVI